MYTYFGAFALMISGFFVVFGQEIAVFLFGEAFRFSGYMLQYAAPCLIFNCWATISLNILAGMGKIKQRLGVVALALGINVILNLIFLILLGKGLLFSAMILSVSWGVMALGAMRIIGKEYPFTLDGRFLVKNIIIIGILCGVMWRAKRDFSILGRWKFGGMLLVFFVGYGVVLAGMNRKKIIMLMNEVKKLKEER
ncbi:MAG: polysaccharide biosynthesis C-terminal domain-containing protein [Candidatus Peribacteria bacterium]|jgi:O-antigen/teichoic acid export membrane protein|nr:polysaccharide biosynthesis C-terminal domain-containing protein [Candidatus Peribacteria bacterium]